MPARVPLIIAPTPLHRLDRLSEKLQLDLWIKRDDLTGFAFGGNKGRKLEYLIGEAHQQGADAVVTCGSIQSNFIRQLGAACAMHGIRCVAAAMHLPYDKAAGRPSAKAVGRKGGNATLDEIVGVEMEVGSDDDWEVLFARAEDAALRLEREGRKVYRVPVGGSNALGALAFFQAGEELIEQQQRPFDWIVHATSSGSTQTGLTYRFHDSTTRVVGIACDPEPGLAEDFAKIGEVLADLLGGRPLPASTYSIDFGSVGAGYGVSSPDGEAAIRMMALSEGIFLDPVYTGKAFAGLIRLARAGTIAGRALFWHTGGTPALFAHD